MNLGHYNIIYADPPWKYRDKQTAGKRGAAFKYECMDVEDIANFKVDGTAVSWLAPENAACFMWVPDTFLVEGLFVMRAWGFAYKKIGFTWAKRTKHGKWHMGMGHYTRANPEFCLLGLRGKLKVQSHSVRALIEAPIGKHSAKPPETRDRIVELFGDVPRIELFARERVEGWDSDGLEIKA